ncbi:hypothetical protein SAMN05421690_10132 [Nitrosomonas sp. Nm51]|nr:hypothetical protein SAMN05421690_10132 [Nitrosomonas sp. Nm51]
MSKKRRNHSPEFKSRSEDLKTTSAAQGVDLTIAYMFKNSLYKHITTVALCTGKSHGQSTYSVITIGGCYATLGVC